MVVRAAPNSALPFAPRRSPCLLTSPYPPFHRNSAKSDYAAEAIGDILLSFPEFLELLGLASFAAALGHNWTGGDEGSVLTKISSLIRETAALGAPWAKLAQGQKLLSACSAGR